MFPFNKHHYCVIQYFCATSKQYTLTTFRTNSLLKIQIRKVSIFLGVFLFCLLLGRARKLSKQYDGLILHCTFL